MKNLIIIIIVLFLNYSSKAQMIKAFSCVISEKDSVVTYNLKVRFDSDGGEEKLLELVKAELERNYQIKTDKIISIESFIDKKYLTTDIGLKLKKNNMKFSFHVC